VQKTFDLPGKKGVAHVIIRKDGHLKDRPYQIELRPNCGNSESIELADLHVKDAHSSCKDPVGTISLSTDGNKVQLQIFKRLLAWILARLLSLILLAFASSF